MATYVLIHGAGDVGWYWHLVAAELRERGHEVVAPDLPCEDESAGWWDYADAVVEAMGDRSHLVVVGHSMGGFTAPLVCARRPAVSRGRALSLARARAMGGARPRASAAARDDALRARQTNEGLVAALRDGRLFLTSDQGDTWRPLEAEGLTSVVAMAA